MPLLATTYVSAGVEGVIREVYVQGYRSIRSLRLELEDVNVVVGGNGTGKTNLYRSLCLIAAGAKGELAETIAREGGMESVMWAGPRREKRRRLALSATIDEYHYELVCGLPIPHEGSAFVLDPEVKEELLIGLGRSRKRKLLERKSASAKVRNNDGEFVTFPVQLAIAESILAQIQEPHRFPELSILRQEIQSWRFYHDFRTDSAAPARQPQIGVRSPVLDAHAHNLAAALRTIIEVGDADTLHEAIQLGFPGSRLMVEANQGRFELKLAMPAMFRPFEAHELSDGTLRYLCLITALLSPRPPSLLAFNEPESSLHPGLLEPLARLLVGAAERSQIWVTTHSRELANYIRRFSGCPIVELERVEGETRVVD